MLMRWPEPEPEPKPGESSLYENVDWMTFTHEQLYAMANQGVDLGGANAVAARWAQLGDALQEIGDELAQALAASAEAWQGEAADMARGTMSELSTWANTTGATAMEVSGCVSIEANNAEDARRSMPEPVPGIRGPVNIPLHTANSTSPMSAAFDSARDLIRDPAVSTAQQQAAHEEAARVMTRFQNASREVYGTVPEFSPPALQHRLKYSEPPTPPPSPTPSPSPSPEPVPVAPPPPAQELTGERPATRGAPPPPPPPSQSGPGAPPSPAAPGKQPGAVEARPIAEEHPAASPAQGGGTSSTSARPAAAGMGAMGAGAGHKEEDKERKSPRYLEGDTDIWGIADRLAPPVIGDDGA